MLGALAKIASSATSPTYATLAKAQGYDPALTLDEYALARVVASEFGSGSPTEMGCIADADVNRAAARGLSLFDHITERTGEFGSQGHGSPRKMSSRLDPAPRHLEVAIAAVRRGLLGVLPPALYGIARGAIQYMDPRAQAKFSNDDAARNCPPLVILERWTYSKEWVDRSAGCELAAKHGAGQLEWVGPIAGVDPYQLMLFRPATANQDLLFGEAKKVIESGGSYKGLWPLPPTDVAIAVLLIASAWAMRGGFA